MPDNEIGVVPLGGGWKVGTEPDVYATEERAVAVATELLRAAGGGRLLVHDADGTVRTSRRVEG